MAYKDFNYRDKSAPKLSDEFKLKFLTNIKGKEAIKAEGLTAFAHEKGIWKFETKIIQFPSDVNNWTAICQTTVGGYDWDPSEQKLIKVEYTDIGDANQQNCTSMVKASYIRMASTRSQARALRKYTNIDMVSADEIGNVMQEEMISEMQLEAIKNAIKQKQLTPDIFADMLRKAFGHVNYNALTEAQGNVLLNIINHYQQAAPEQPRTDNNSGASQATNQNNESQPVFSADSLSQSENPF